MAKQPTIQNFISSMNKSGGFARTSKYAVVITPPTNLNRIFEDSKTTTYRDGVTERGDRENSGNIAKMIQLNRQLGPQVNLHCNTVSMPGHDLQAQDQQHGSAPGRQIVSSHDYAGTIAASFYLDSHLRERHFFETWQSMAVNNNTHKANYYDDYIGTMEIYQLDLNGEVTYGIKATEVYPSTIGGIEYAYANTNQIATQAVQFQYRQWFNLTSDAIASYSADRMNVQRSEFKTVKKTYGPLDIETTSSSVREKQLERGRQKQLRPPEIDRQDTSRRSGIKEAKRQEQLRPPTRK